MAVSRHYYTPTKRFEQSLDVYKPSAGSGNPTAPLVVLVVGSAWLGHRWSIYAGTSWWNSSGPKTVAKVGAVCVCIRHRGAFPFRPFWPTALPFLPVSPSKMSTGVLALAFAALLTPLRFVLPLVVLALALWSWAAAGAATHADMMDDVASALLWVREHRSELAAAPNQPPQGKLIFGGYSSGAHVAACLLQRPRLLKERGLPPPTELCDGVLFLSGVLGTRLTCAPSAAPLGAPALTDAILASVVFGADAAAALPSPVHDVDASPALPHLLVCCAHEVFGLPVVEAAMGVFFASREFSRRLTQRGVAATLVEVESDHWFVLGSEGLAQALRQHLFGLAEATSSPCT